MIKQKRGFVLLSVLIAAALFSMSCGLFTRASELRSTVQAGQGLIQTGQAVITEVGSSGLPQTAQAVATQVAAGGLERTIQAVATEIDESGVPATLQAAVTEVVEGGLPQTAQAAITQVVLSPENVPEDIPLFYGEKSAFVGTPQTISYFVSADFNEVLTFYQGQMPDKGWTKVDYGTVITSSSAELHYEKAGRKATIVITRVPVLNQTTIVITLQD